MQTLINIARMKGVSAYIGDGLNRWPAVSRFDAAHLYRLALDKAPAGSLLYGRAEEGVPFRDISNGIGRHLNLPVVSISREEADVHFGYSVYLTEPSFVATVNPDGLMLKRLTKMSPRLLNCYSI